MNANFWTTQNIVVLAIALMAVPTGAGAGLFLLKKSKGQVDVEPVASVVELARETPEPFVEPQPTPKPVVKAVTPFVKPKPKLSDSGIRLMERVDQAYRDGELYENSNELRSALTEATIVEKIHTVAFRPGKLGLDDKDESYLLAALQNNDSFRRYRDNPNASLIVMGYASQDGDSRNNRFALTRARSTEDAIVSNSANLGFEGLTKCWCVGETTVLSDEANDTCTHYNRAAEVWLVVEESNKVAAIKSDKIEQPYVIVRKTNCR